MVVMVASAVMVVMVAMGEPVEMRRVIVMVRMEKMVGMAVMVVMVPMGRPVAQVVM